MEARRQGRVMTFRYAVTCRYFVAVGHDVEQPGAV
jgi:hypothetical protein